jgi:hypothetical protein
MLASVFSLASLLLLASILLLHKQCCWILLICSVSLLLIFLLLLTSLMLLAAKLKVFYVRDNLVISASAANSAVQCSCFVLTSCYRESSNSPINRTPATAVGQ